MAVKWLNEDVSEFTDTKLRETERQELDNGDYIIRYVIGPYSLNVRCSENENILSITINNSREWFSIHTESNYNDKTLPRAFIIVGGTWLENIQEIEEYQYKLEIAKQCYQELIDAGLVVPKA